MIDHLLASHADAVVLDRDRLGRLIDLGAIAGSTSGSRTSRLVSKPNWSRCRASEAFEISSRRKISRSV
jgi:hypothetical protein